VLAALEAIYVACGDRMRADAYAQAIAGAADFAGDRK
jgi:hypothetical protein